MSSRKRARQAVGDEEVDEGVIDILEARTNFGQDSSQKRRRTSNGETDKHTAPRETTPLSDNDPANDDDNVSLGRNSPPRTQYEIMRDDGFRHLANEDLDDQRATQMIKARPQRIGDNRAAENGIIESVECINFMCHERLYVELGPLINFIVGENGSGKSAVLTALTLCLGGKASSTNRGGSLKSFIKEGRENSVITVAIKNTGVDSFQADLYGRTIKVERHFNKSGTSGFRLRSERGKIISTRKADIDEITEYWGLQVDNPLNVLSQDNARQFLNAATPAHKYKFFYKGVQLEQLDHDYNFVSETLSSHEAKLPELEERASRADRDYKKALENKKAADRNQGMRHEGERLRKKLVWCQVVDEEKELEKRDADVASFENQSILDTQAIVKASEQLEAYDQKVAQYAEEVAVKVGEKDVQQEAVEMAQARNDKATAELKDLHRQERDVYQQLKNAGKSVKDCEHSIEMEKKKLGEGAGRERQQIQDKLDLANTEEQDIKKQLDQLQEELPRMEIDTLQAVAEAKQCKGKVQNKKQEVQESQSRLHTLRSKAGNDTVNPTIDRLIRSIQQDSGFERQPIGPIGAHIQLLKPAWSSILESIFGQFLNNFLVVSKRDHHRLNDHMRRLGINNTGVVIGKSLPPGIVLKEPDMKYLTVLRALKFENDWVRDQLIVNHSIEKIILVESRVDGQEIMFNGSPPRDVIACLTHHDTKRGEGVRLTARGNLNTSPIQGWGRRIPRMKSDAGSRVAEEEISLAELQEEFRAVQTEHRQLEAFATQCHDKETRHRQTTAKLDHQLIKTQAKIEELSASLDEFEGVDDRLASLQTKLNEALGNKDYHGGQYGEMKVRKEELNKESERCKRALQHERDLFSDLEPQLAKIEAKLKRAQDTRQLALVAKNAAYQAQTDTIERHQNAVQLRDEQAATVAAFTEQAMSAVPERVSIDPGETAASIEKKYETIRKHLAERARQIGMTDEEISRRLNETKEAFKYWTEFYRAQAELHHAGKRSLQDRMKKWRIFQALISAHSRMNFQYLLSERGFRGNLLFDHKNRKLQLSVEPDETRRSAAGRSTKTLSGGEKSFSSICMLLAIWEAMGSPLRCLDEFDVFMDNVNRTISTNMLVNAARNSVSKQYIMITPNAIEGRAALDKDVKIIRLTDPRQTRLI